MIRFGNISLRALSGRAYVWLTVITCLTFCFHFIPATAETATRLPVGAPWANHPEAPQVLLVTRLFFVAFLIGVGIQLRRLRRGGSGAGRADLRAHLTDGAFVGAGDARE